jgi:hypothetical protein
MRMMMIMREILLHFFLESLKRNRIYSLMLSLFNLMLKVWRDSWMMMTLLLRMLTPQLFKQIRLIRQFRRRLQQRRHLLPKLQLLKHQLRRHQPPKLQLPRLPPLKHQLRLLQQKPQPKQLQQRRRPRLLPLKPQKLMHHHYHRIFLKLPQTPAMMMSKEQD